MATERFIRGKVDSCKHDGKYANQKRLEQAEYHLQHWQEELIEMEEGIEYNLDSMKNSANELVRNKSPWQNPQQPNNPNI